MILRGRALDLLLLTNVAWRGRPFDGLFSQERSSAEPFSGPLPAGSYFPQLYGGYSQQIYCALCNLSFDPHKILVRNASPI
jgi:hypothetical protein